MAFTARSLRAVEAAEPDLVALAPWPAAPTTVRHLGMNASHHVPGTVPLAGVVPSPQTVETYVAGLPEAAPYRELDARSNIRRGPSAPGPGPRRAGGAGDPILSSPS